jgi:S1-C subfamily serine protease
MLSSRFPSHNLQAQDSPRITPAVKVIESVRSAVLPIFTQSKDGVVGAGAGVIIHPAGFILTADHVTQNHNGLVLFDLERVPYEVVGRVPERDIALLKVDPAKIESTIQVGRSDDLKAGEPILIGGNPSGRGLVFAQGTINAPLIDPSWPSVLAKSFWTSQMPEAEFRHANSTGGRPHFIQFDASSNGGNSGGPVINLNGELVGIVAIKSKQEEAVNWAVPIDVVRIFMPYLVQAEAIGDFQVGIELDMLSESAFVSNVEVNSPAWHAGIRSTDRIQSIDGIPTVTPVDCMLLLWGHRAGETLSFELKRDGTSRSVDVVLSAYCDVDAVTSEGKQTGIRYKLYRGRFPAIPKFDAFEVAKEGIVSNVGFEGVVTEKDSNFAIVFDGYVEFPEAGLYRVGIGSDDGSKLILNGRLVIDNDLQHPPQRLSKWIRVPKGLTSIRVEYADAGGGKALILDICKDIELKDKAMVKFYADQHANK